MRTVTSQIFRHTAVVLAGMARIGFTVAAGTYVVNQMAADQHEAAGTPRPEDGVAEPIAPPPPQAAGPEVPQPSTAAVRFVAETRELPVTRDRRAPVVPAPAPARPRIPTTAAVQARSDPSGRLPLPGDAYIGANLTRPEPDSLSITLDTNLFDAPADTAAAGGTRLRTDLDVRNGRITLALTNPLLSTRSVPMTPPQDDPANPNPHTTGPTETQPATSTDELATA
ncbi:hypothetical protein [Nocardia vaccinii]|uniref:hypothetical protein n=1 Tax=Nocardia vaccinii TaxID=1822 RepID=UPI00082FF7A5|nr:hypothetical protein [Nocardia vaccinii]